MFRARSILVLLACLAAGWGGGSGAWGAGRYLAAFADGSRLEGNSLVGWNTPESSPTLDGRLLLLPDNPIRWLRDRSLRPAETPEAFIELVSGDRLPGIVTGYRRPQAGSFEATPAHFLVKPAVALERPGTSPLETIRVVERFVRRIVWQHRAVDRYEPGRLFFRDGRSLAFRSARVTDEGVQVLLEDGNQKAGFGEIAELHLPAVDPWESYCEELAAISPAARTPLIQLLDTQGLVVTTSLERLVPAVAGAPNEASRWLHVVQPAWSLETLWVRNEGIWLRRLFRPDRPPLSRLQPRVASSSPLGGGERPLQSDKNVEGGLLASGGDEFGWGFGVHAPCLLRFPLPAWAVGVESVVGLDRIAAAGGCARGRISVVAKGKEAATGKRLYESPFLVGSGKSEGSGLLVIPGDAPHDELVLEADMAHVGRPAGADPLDIRDLVDWLEPILWLDPVRLTAEVRKRIGGRIPAWEGWNLAAASQESVTFANFFTELEKNRPGAFRLAVHAAEAPLVLRREIEIRPQDQYLVAAAYVVRDGLPGPHLEVRIDGDLVADYVVPSRRGAKDDSQPVAPPLVVPLAPYVGHKITIEVSQTSAAAVVPVDWRLLRLSEHLPTLFRGFEDAAQFVSAVDPPRGEATLVEEEAHSGKASVKITPDGRFRLAFGQTARIRANPQWGEYRFVRFAFRKFGQGRVSIELEHDGERDRVVRYDAGTGPPSLGQAKRVWALDLPSEWIVMTQDLYADFGELNVTGIVLSVPDGQHAFFDQIYLARNEKDLEQIPSPSPEETNRKARSELAKRITDKALPATVALEFDGGRWGTGTILDAQGHILTAGHLVCRPGMAVTAHLADGRKLAGKTLGMWRKKDVGLVKLDEPKDLASVELGPSRDLAPEQLMVGVAHQPGYEAGRRPQAHVTNLNRVTFNDQTLWTGFDLERFLAGGGLFDREGRLIGVHSRRSQFGGFIYTQSDDFREALDRMKRSEVWDEWEARSGPVFGVTITTANRQCRVVEVVPDSAAAKADIQVGDLITKVGDKAVEDLSDIYRVLGTKNPGDEVTVDVERGKEKRTVTMKLEPRVP